MVFLASRVMRDQKVTGEPRDSQVPEERMAQKDKRGLRGCLVMRVPREQQGRRASLGCQVSQVIQDAQDLRDLLDFLDPWDHWGRKASGAKQGSQGRKENVAHRAPEETEDSRGPQASLAPREIWARTGLLGPLEKRVYRVCKVPQDSLGQKAPQVLRGKMGYLDTLDKEENWASKVRQAPLDQLASLVLRVR